MIPFAIAGMEIRLASGESTEISLEELSADSVLFRTSFELATSQVSSPRLFFYHGDDNTYHYCSPKEYRITLEEKRGEVYLFRMETEDAAFAAEANHLWKEYAGYIELKQDGDSAALSAALTAYPADKEQCFADSFAVQSAEWYKSAVRENNWAHCKEDFEFAIALDSPKLYEEYLTRPVAVFLQEYWERRIFEGHPLTQKTVNRLYIGNQFCQQLLPDEELSLRLVQKAWEEGLAVTMVFTYMREDRTDEYKHFFSVLHALCEEHDRKMEILVNDWGMISLLKHGCERFTLCMGILLNKRRKDPRVKYLPEFKANTAVLEANALSNSVYLEYLRKECRIERFEWESTGSPMALCKGRHSLHFPYYQTNTSQYCPLYARCKEGSRGKQKYSKTCPGYCKDYVFLYPEHLHMVGMYNSLFGYDAESLRDGEKMETYLQLGVDRLVINLM